MGLCISDGLSAAERHERHRDQMRNFAIERTNAIDNEADAQVKKLLLLGAGESGKSTLFKQMIDLYGTGFTEKEILEYIPIVHNNAITAMQTLCTQIDSFKGRPEMKADFPLKEENQIHRQAILGLDPEDSVTMEIAQNIKALWSDPLIKRLYELRSNFQLIDSADHFFEHIESYAKPEFRPSKQDILRCRVRTTGILDTSFKIENLKFRMFDVGGQRNERKKWIHCFENVTAVIFVAALSEYDQRLYEDNTTNRLTEALNLFEEVLSLRWFQETSVILFLNKKDLFEEKLKKAPLKDYLPDYSGDNTFEDAWKFIGLKFTALKQESNRQIYTYVTCATDDQNVMFVFNSVKDIVLRKGLMSSGLM
jgi:GTPase SAR1 family protein